MILPLEEQEEFQGYRGLFSGKMSFALLASYADNCISFFQLCCIMNSFIRTILMD